MTLPIEVTLRGNVGSFAGDHARDKVTRALAVAGRPVLHAHLVLDVSHDPARPRPAVATVSVDVDGTRLRARAAAPTMPEAVDELEARLRGQLVRLRERDRARHRWTGVASGHEWRHGDLPRRPVPWFPRPEDSREVVRSTSTATTAMTVDEAAYEMDLLDHDFLLYRDAGSGRPALVHHLPGGGFAVQGADPAGAAATVTREPSPPTMTDAAARTRLDVDDEPFVFYLDADTGEGRVLYHRHDGHYGLITVAG